MSDIEFRPRFRIETSMEEKQVADIVKRKLSDDNPDKFESTIVKDHLILKINQQKRHFWSPQMDVSLGPKSDEEGTLIRCLLAPQPSVWTMFMFLYTISGFGAFIGLMITLSQWTLDKEMWGIWLTGISTFIGVALFFIAQFGKGISKDEMKSLKSYITEIDFPRKKD